MLGNCEVSIKQYPPGLRMFAHGHDLTGLSVVLAGSLVEDVGHVRVQARAGSAVLKPRGTIHANEFGPQGATLLRVVFKDARDVFDENARPTWRWNRCLPTMRSAVQLLDTLQGRLPESSRRAGDADDALAELISEAMVLPRQTGPVPRWLEAVRCRLDDERERRPSVTELAEAARVHPVYLARRFRDAYGCSVAHYRRSARVLAVLPAIASATGTLTDIAAAHGFSDQSHLSRECRSSLGMTPSRLRKMLLE